MLLVILSSAAASKKKKRQPRLPDELHAGCPFHRDEAEPGELSEFGHELERPRSRRTPDEPRDLHKTPAVTASDEGTTRGRTAADAASR